MTKLLEKAIAKARQLSEDEQDALALTIMTLAESHAPLDPVDAETRAAILEGLEQARRGEFMPDEKVQALWKRHGL